MYKIACKINLLLLIRPTEKDVVEHVFLCKKSMAYPNFLTKKKIVILFFYKFAVKFE